jgi:hypothetical protein
VFLDEKQVLEWAFLQACILDKVRDRPIQKDWEDRLHGGSMYWNQQGGEHIVKETCLGQFYSFLVCELGFNN